MKFGFMELVVILVIVLVLFGAGRLTRVMGDFGKGIRAMKEGLKSEDGKDEATAALPPADKKDS